MDPLYLKEPYLKEVDATVLEVSKKGKGVIFLLDQDLFQPNSREGGDRGSVVGEHGDFQVKKAVLDRKSGEISLSGRLNGEINEGDQVRCVLDWDLRYTLMKKHSAAHIIYGFGKQYLKKTFLAISKVSQGESYTQWMGMASRTDALDAVFEQADLACREGKPISWDYATREEAVCKCGNEYEESLPGNVKRVRVVTIDGLDSHPCIGLHVKNSREIGGILFNRSEVIGEDLRMFFDTAL